MKQTIVKQLSKHLDLSKKQIEKLIEIPPSPEMGDYAFPCFTLSKQQKKSPNQIAQELSLKLKSKDFEQVDPNGPYVNFFVNRKTLAEQTLQEIMKKRDKFGSSNSGKGSRVMVEFSQANTHKAFHVGHVRGTSLGESISRILEFTGSKVIKSNYQGDTGMHVAKWIWCYRKYHKKEKLNGEEAWIASVYVDAVKRLEKNPKLQSEVDEVNRKLDSKEDKFINELWEKSRNFSLEAFEKIYKELNTHFDRYFFESEGETRAKELAEDLLKKGIAEISEGAMIVDLKKYNLGVWVLLRNDKTVLYSAKDLALAERKFKEFGITKSIHVVGSAQRLYFHQLFKVLELMKFKKPENFVYIPVSEVRFPWGKMSSRTGENVLYSQFKQEMLEAVSKELKKRQKLKAEELKERALAIAISAIKYPMLKQDINKSFIFDKTSSMSFEGDTGPYLLYTYARARSILRKSKYKQEPLKIKDIDAHEKNLIFQLSVFPEMVKKATDYLAPNVIANYAFSLSKTFAEFYHSHKVIHSENEAFRLMVVDAFSQVLKNSLNLLGITPLESM